MSRQSRGDISQGAHGCGPVALYLVRAVVCNNFPIIYVILAMSIDFVHILSPLYPVPHVPR